MDNSKKTVIALALEFHNNLPLFHRLSSYFENWQNLWQETPASLANKVGLKLSVCKFLERKELLLQEVDTLLEEITSKGISLITILDASYPELLRHIYYPPPILYYKGNLAVFTRPMIGIVGTRKPTSKGALSSYQLGRLIVSQNEVVVSGGARGVDSSAHQGALKEKGDLQTVVVAGSGLDVIYPRENRYLFQEVEKRGLLLSENRPGTPPLQRNFPRRNRIIAGLSQKLIVVQAPKKSGALITADFSLEQGRDVFVVPWPDNILKGLGNRKLLSEGALPLITGGEIYPKCQLTAALPISKPDEKKIALLKGIEKLVFGQVGFEKKSVSRISYELNLSVQKVFVVTSKLEIEQLIIGWPGQSYTKSFIL